MRRRIALLTCCVLAVPAGTAHADMLRSVSAVSLSSAAAGASGVSWSLSFTTSAHGELTARDGTITVTAPPGATLPTCGAVKDVTSGLQLGGCGSRSGDSVTYPVGPVAAGD